MDNDLALRISNEMGKGPPSKGPMYLDGKKYQAGEYPEGIHFTKNSLNGLTPKAFESLEAWQKEFDRRIQQAIIKVEGSLPDDLSTVTQHGRITIDPDGTRRFIWRGEEKFHMRIDVNWREDGR